MPPPWAQRAGENGPAWAERSRRKRRRHEGRKISAARGWANSDLGGLLQTAQLPAWWVELCVQAAAAAVELPVVFGLEVFSGRGELSQAFRDLAGPFLSFEIADDPEEDISTMSGVLLALKKLFCVRAGGLLWLGTPCKSWVVLSRSFTQRSLLQPAGPVQCRSKRQREYLDQHNCIAERSAFLARTATVLQVFFVIEQPSSSLLANFEPVRVALETTAAVKASISMCRFGGESKKPLTLRGTGDLSTLARVNEIRKEARPATKKLTTRSPGGFFTGKKEDLEASAAYTRCFGIAVALCYQGLSPEAVAEELSEQGL